MTKSWKTSYGNSDDPQQMISELVIDYFNEIGGKLIAARESGVKLTIGSVNPIYVNSMRQIGLVTTTLSGSFNCGKESEVAQSLFGAKGSMSYYGYIEKVYKLLCEEIEGDWTYVSRENATLQSAINIIQDSMKRYGGANIDTTFNDLYKFIQVAKRDGFGYYEISEDKALHIYDNKQQVNICKKDEHDEWISISNFVFRPDEHGVTIYDVTNGNADYENGHKFSMRKRILSLDSVLKTPQKREIIYTIMSIL